MLIEKTNNKYNLDTKVIVGIGMIAVVLMIYFAINMYQMVSHVGKLANNTEVMTQQMIILGDNIKKINNNTYNMHSNINSIDKGIKTMTTPTGWINMWRK